MTHLAGWLFADLLLVLVLIVLGGQTIQNVGPAAPESSPAARASAEPSAKASATASPSASASASASARSRTGMDPVSKRLKLLVSQDVADGLRGSGDARDAARRRINEEVDRVLAGEKRRGAMIFVWGSDGGCAACTANSDLSSRYADAAAEAIVRGRHRLLPRASAFYRGYIDLSGASGALRMEVFFYNA
ncbi:hypothetical protein ACFWVC_33400 [Streptomyces sp. NPDC058691]|uniref:hypothetical protein n=1 Tax=Streptomyces sp. NPDC058691 TaxID=3346601 RepID=UPI00366384B1